MSSPQPPDGGQQGQQPQGAGEQPGGAPNNQQDTGQGSADATQVVRPAQPPQGQQQSSDSTQVVPPAMQPPQPMYQQPGTQSQPGGFPAQPQGMWQSESWLAFESADAPLTRGR